MIPEVQLREEHEGITSMLKILERVCAKMEAKEKMDQVHLEKILEFFKTFADEYHHGKEEGLLFPALFPLELRLISVLLGEHSQGRSHVRAMGQGLTWRKKFGDRTGADYAAHAKKYIGLMTQHIRKENDVLFPMLDRLLGKKVQRELAAGFAELERRKISEGIHEQSHQLLLELKEIYPE